jgi:tRNA (mo5U34)-methyltransferase
VTTPAAPPAGVGIRERVEAHPFWYHSIDLGPGWSTHGWFDLRSAVDRWPWPELRGKRCLDIGTFDGFLAFEMERRGAAEVVAIDIPEHWLWDWPPDNRPTGPDDTQFPAMSGPAKGEGFRLAAEALGSSAQWRALSIYDLDPDDIGTFDVITCGSLMLHLRDPLRALEAVRGVCRGLLLSSEQIELWLSIVGRGIPLFRLNGSGPECQWWLPNGAGHKRILYAAGFAIEQLSRPFVVTFNHHPIPPATLRNRVNGLATRLMTGQAEPGVLHRAVLARPRV